jgi:hypothetical protein
MHGAVYRTALRSFRRVLEGLTLGLEIPLPLLGYVLGRPRGGLEVNDEFDLGWICASARLRK